MKRPSGSLLAWACYDLANTFFAVAMISFHFPLWVVEDRGAKELLFSLAVGASMLIVALLMPLCGAISDTTHQRMRYLRQTTLVCIAAMLAMGFTQDLRLALGLFIVANICYQLGTVFYDALLSDVAGGSDLGPASGFGAAGGYLGSMLGLACLWPFAQAGGHHATFVPAAVLFLLFALPCFLVIRDPVAPSKLAWGEVLRTAIAQLNATVLAVRRSPAVMRFLLASFFSLNAINTILVFMVVYTKKVLGFSEGDVIRFFLWGQLFAVIGSLVFGRLTPRWGSKRTLQGIWIGWTIALALICVSRRAVWLWAIAPVIGLCLGSTWSTSRVLLIELAPKEDLAKYFGLAGLLGRSSSILGPILWGLIVLDPSRYRHALLALVGLLLIGLWIFRRVPDPRTLSLVHPQEA